jgi:hypothetical protein
VTVLIIGSILLGAILGRSFTVLILVPVSLAVFAIAAARFAYFGHGLLRLIFEFAVLITSFQIGYGSHLLSAAVPGLWQRLKKQRTLAARGSATVARHQQ